MQQYFVNQELSTGKVIELSSQQSHHIATVLRSKQGKVIRLIDENSLPFYAVITSLEKNVIVTVGESIIEKRESDVRITLAVAMIRSDRFEWILEKATECGVFRIVPFFSARCVVKDKPGQNRRKMERFQKIVTEAAEQSYRHIVPKIIEPVLLKQLHDYKSDLNLVAYEKESENQLSQWKGSVTSVTIVIGPEGGFENSEIEFLNAHGFTSVTLGRRIYRAETAAIAACVTLVNLGEHHG